MEDRLNTNNYKINPKLLIIWIRIINKLIMIKKIEIEIIIIITNRNKNSKILNKINKLNKILYKISKNK